MSPEQRKRAMRSNRGRTRPERALASALWKRGLRYFTCEGYARRTGERLTGQPDIVFSAARVAVFVDGCFWHGCPTCGGIPEGVSPFWKKKISRTVERDKQVTAELEGNGWTVIRVAEHDLGSKRAVEKCAEKLWRNLAPPT